jgi:hypothetical protein
MKLDRFGKIIFSFPKSNFEIMVFERTTLSSLTKNFVFELSLDACGRDPTPEQLLHLQGQGKTQPILIPGADELSSQGYTPGSQA